MVLDKGQRDDWFASHLILGLAIVSRRGAGRRGLLGMASRRIPIIDLHLFATAPSPLGNLLMFMLGFVLLSSTVLLPAVRADAAGLHGGAGRTRADAGRLC